MTRPLPRPKQQVPDVLRHLHHLTRSFVHDGERISYVGIYARPSGPHREPPFTLITARESGFEGIACVDDAARAALLALQVYEQMGDPAALRLAHAWLGFVTYMQEPDGRFTNFIRDEAGAKNRHGRTSRAGGRWWTARALWALAMAWRVTGEERYRRCFRRGRLTPTGDLKVTAIQALALLELYRREPVVALRTRIGALCDRIVAAGPDYFRDRRGQAEVALWGYHQLLAMARAGHLCARLDYLAACAQTVRTLVEAVVADGFYHVYPLEREQQCAYDVSTLVVGLEELYRVTRQQRYRELALACAAWLDGDNPAGAALYDPRTGCCSDGIAHGVASLHCGAESAIEAGFIELARRRLSPKASTTSRRPDSTCNLAR